LAKKPVPNDPPGEPTFEQSLHELERIVHDLEEGQIGLDESLQHYEQGVKLLRRLLDLLEKAERRIELLTGLDASGNPVCEPLADEATLAPEEKSQRRSARHATTEGGTNSSDGGTDTSPPRMDEAGGTM